MDWPTIITSLTGAGVISGGVSLWVSRQDRKLEREKWDRERTAEARAAALQSLIGMRTALEELQPLIGHPKTTRWSEELAEAVNRMVGDLNKGVWDFVSTAAPGLFSIKDGNRLTDAIFASARAVETYLSDLKADKVSDALEARKEFREHKADSFHQIVLLLVSLR